MPGLREVQVRFADHLFGRRDELLSGLINANGLSPERRLQLYHNNVFISLMETLQALYPVVEKLVGEDYFRQAAHRYVEQYPSRNGNILNYGEEFPDFLETAPGLEALRYVPEIAQLEWNVHRVFHAADATSLNPSALTEIPPEEYVQLVFEPHPASCLAASRYPLFDIWQLATGQSELEQIDLDSGPDWLLILRRDLETELFRLSEGEYRLLSGMAEGKPLGTCYEYAAAQSQDFNLQDALARLFQLGTLTGFSLAAEQ
ncbi:MAG: DNA-binding domain-containing protein [Pseudomonadota bacterium]|nr:DNA-binding domain-containing protein [Pseudomonadota bacterium]